MLERLNILEVITKAFAVPVAAFLTLLCCAFAWAARMNETLHEHVNERRHHKRFRQTRAKLLRNSLMKEKRRF